MTPRLIPLRVRADGIPVSLRAVRRFVVWRYEYVNGRWTKVPYVATNPVRHASSTNPDTWSSFDEALTAVEHGGGDGLGIVLDGGRLIAVDLDHCIADGLVVPWAQTIIDTLDSFTEQSPSGEGIRILLWADGLPPRGRKHGDIEVYNNGRYVTLTGHHLSGTPTDLQERSEAIAAVHAGVFGANAPVPPPVPGERVAEHLDDAELLGRARAASNGDKFARLWAGDFSRYPSHSEADAALCGLLAFWTQCDPPRMDALFRQSGLMRPKWDSARVDRTYGARLIDWAIEHTPRVCGDVPLRRPSGLSGLGGLRGL